MDGGGKGGGGRWQVFIFDERQFLFFCWQIFEERVVFELFPLIRLEKRKQGGTQGHVFIKDLTSNR